MSSLLMLPMPYSHTPGEIQAMSYVCTSKLFCLLSHCGRHWHPPSHSFLPAHKNDTFTMFVFLKLLIMQYISAFSLVAAWHRATYVFLV